MRKALSVTCAEDVVRINPAEIAAVSRNTFLGDYRIRQQMEACKLWPLARLAADHFTPPPVSQVPTLFLSGSADPVTPPRWAAVAARYLPNSASVVFPGGGHVPFTTSCARRLATQLLATASVARMDVSCGREYARPPFTLPPR